MTIIAYDQELDVIYVDSKYTWGNGRPPHYGSKIEHCDDVVFAVAGEPTDRPWVMLGIQSIKEHKHLVRDVPDSLFFGAIVRMPNREVFLVDKNQGENFISIVRISGSTHDWVIGSGASYYTAFMACGSTVADAVVQTCLVNITCGGVVEKY